MSKYFKINKLNICKIEIFDQKKKLTIKLERKYLHKSNGVLDEPTK